jgi:hypothetical protein
VRGVFRLAFVALAIAGVAASFSACGSSSVALGSKAGASCANVGGKCVLGGARCKTSASSEADDCNPSRNAGGGHCCIEVEDEHLDASGVGCRAAPVLEGGSDASPGCNTALFVLSCVSPGMTEECSSDDPTTCPDATPGATCTKLCKPVEYGASCGRIGPGPSEPPPPTCRSVGATPAGITHYCCPC